MRFCIVTVGWHCAKFVEQTLRSVEEQTDQDWDLCIIVDPSPDGSREAVQAVYDRWCDTLDWPGDVMLTFNREQRFAVRNQYDAIQQLNPADDDVIVWLDLDGDRFAHPHVLARLREHYENPHLLLTYGNYRPEPNMGTSTFPSEYPPNVIAQRSFRADTLRSGCRFNHLRTMRGVVFRNIPENQFKWATGPNAGDWYVGGVDYEMMLAGLELAGNRHAMLPEVLLIYNHANPLADHLIRSAESHACTMDFLQRPPLPLLEVSSAEVG